MILTDAFIFPISQLQTEQVMTSQISSHIEYLIYMYFYSCADVVVEMDEKSNLNCGF